MNLKVAFLEGRPVNPGTYIPNIVSCDPFDSHHNIDGEFTTLGIGVHSASTEHLKLLTFNFQFYQCLVLYFSIHDRKSFLGLINIAHFLRDFSLSEKYKFDREMPIVLVGDDNAGEGEEKERRVGMEEGEELAREVGAVFYAEVSSSKGEAVGEFFANVCRVCSRKVDICKPEKSKGNCFIF